MIEKLDISSSCHFESLSFNECTTHWVSLEYVEHSPDAWYSDNSTSIDIDKEKAQEIVNFLYKHFGVKPE